MADIDNFFSFQNKIDELTEADSQQLNNYIATVDAFARTTYMSMYLIDYHTKRFDYVSENPLFLCGLSAEEVKEMGYDFYFKFVVKEDLELLQRINTIGFEYYQDIPISERTKYTISYDFRLKNSANNTFLVNHRLTPLFLTEEGKIWKSFCIVSLSENKSPGNIKIYKQNENKFWTYNLEKNYWETNNKIELSERERQILYLSSQGLTINDISDRIFVSVDTVKFHRKKLFEKLEVANITEAISYATNNRLI